MRTGLATAVLCLTLWSATASAQPWRDAFDAGEYRRAVALLHPLVTEAIAETGVDPDAAATELLADLYAKGLGVPADAMMACALLTHAERAAAAAGSRADDAASATARAANAARVAGRRERQCAGLGESERIEALQLLGCPTAAFPKHTFVLSATQSVEVDRQGIRLHYRNTERADQLTLFACAVEVARVRYSRVDPPAGSAGTPRHFLELFTWSRLTNDGEPALALVWHVREIVEGELKPRAMEILHHAPPAWPAPAFSPALAQVELTMDGVGNVKWQFAPEGSPAGLFESEAAASRPRPSHAQRGTR